MAIGSKVTLQTARSCERNGKKRVRVLVDSGSIKPFVTARMLNDADLSATRKKWLEIKTFGGSVAKGRSLRRLLCFEAESVRGERSSVRLEAYVVHGIS